MFLVAGFGSRVSVLSSLLWRKFVVYTVCGLTPPAEIWISLKLVRREVSHRGKYCPRKMFWPDTAKSYLDSHGLKSDAEIDPKRGLVSRSTIAAAFSSDGKMLASTYGDHTVKINDSQTTNCLKILSGHQRTPWVVSFHPLYPELLASGSLDHELRLWNVTSAECIASRDFYRPIASIAFHAEGEFLAVATGHKTRRSLRAVHFHPYDAPLLLTAHDEIDQMLQNKEINCFIKYFDAKVRGNTIRRHPVLKIHSTPEMTQPAPNSPTSLLMNEAIETPDATVTTGTTHPGIQTSGHNTTSGTPPTREMTAGRINTPYTAEKVQHKTNTSTGTKRSLPFNLAMIKKEEEKGDSAQAPRPDPRTKEHGSHPGNTSTNNKPKQETKLP